MDEKEYAKLYSRIFELFQSDEIAIAILNNVAKDRRVELINSRRLLDEKPTVVHGEQPATEKQIKYLKRLGVSHEEELTREEASELIDRAAK